MIQSSQIEVLTTADFDQWFGALDDRLARVRIQARIDRLSLGNAGDWRPVHGPVAELRIDHGPGYRVYYMRAGPRIVILLAGGRKSGQSRDIRRAMELASEMGRA